MNTIRAVMWAILADGDCTVPHTSHKKSEKTMYFTNTIHGRRGPFEDSGQAHSPLSLG